MARSPILIAASRPVSAVHRWLGIALGFMFALWFASGTILSFVPFPALATWERIAGSESIDLARIQVTPAAAAAAGGAAIRQLRLISVGGQPRYVLLLPGPRLVSVSAVSGAVLGPVSGEEASAIAARFSALPAAASDGPFDFDQWTVHNRYDPYRPFYKLSIADEAGTELYVSSRSGEVVQRTRRAERAWNWVGAVAHWLNPTFLRKHEAVWHLLMWWLALTAMVVPVAGLWLGVVRFVNLKRSGRPGLTPYSGWLRRHHTIGLLAGIFALSWISSGWLSLDRGIIFSSDQPTQEQHDRLRGISMDQAAGAYVLARLRDGGSAREIEFLALGGRPLLIRRDGLPRSSAVESADDSGTRSPVLSDQTLVAAVEAAWAPLRARRISAVPRDDAYAGPRSNPLPASARRIELNDPSGTWVHIDAESAQVISVMDTSRRVHRWLVDGLHTFDFPLLNRAGPLWHVLLIVATCAGFLLSCTAIVLGVKRLKRLRS